VGATVQRKRNTTRQPRDFAEVERLRAEAEAAAQRFRDLVQGLDAIVWEADPATFRFTFVSERAQAMLGYTVDQWLSEPGFWASHLHADDRERTIAAYRDAVAGGRDQEIEYRIMAADGRPVWVHDSCRIVSDSDGRARLLRGVLVDISERKAAEAAHTRLSAIIEATTDFVGVSDLEGRTSYINRAGRKLLGIGEEQDLSTVCAAIDQQCDYSRARMLDEVIPAVLRDGVWTGETELLLPNGKEIPVSQVVVGHKTPSGTIDFLATIARDLTDRKRAEDKLAALLEIAKDASGTLDLDELLVRVQPRTAALVSCERVITYYWDPQRDVFRQIAQYGIPPELQDAAQAIEFSPGMPIVNLITQGQTVVVDSERKQRVVPPELLAQFSITAFVCVPLAVRGRVLGSLVAVSTQRDRHFAADHVELLESVGRQVAVAIETTGLYRAQQEEARVAAALARVGRELISSLDTPVILDRLCQLTTEVLGCDCSHTVLWSAKDEAFVPVSGHGYPAEQWETLRLLKIPGAHLAAAMAIFERHEVHQQPLTDYADAAMQALGRELGITVGLGMALRRGDELIGIHSGCYRGRQERFTPQQERIAHGMAQLASMALENARLVEELGRANRLRSEFVATMSHELRTPLNVICGYNELLLDGVFGAVNAEQTETLQRVGKSARELLDLINATLDMSRLESGRVAVNRQDIWVPDLMREIENETQGLHDKPGLRFAWQVPPQLPYVRTDPFKLKMVLKNLIANAAKFTEEGSVTVTVTSDEGHIEFSVADTGIGISPEAQAVIFEPFRQADGSLTRRYGGVGLGLYIVRRLLEMLDGSVAVESEVGRGSTFRVRLPVAKTVIVDE
jgi:PAS domain S-box-containing protein